MIFRENNFATQFGSRGKSQPNSHIFMVIFTTCHCTRGSEDIGIDCPLGSIVRMVRWTLTWTMEIACRHSRRRGFQTKNEIYIFLFSYQILIGWKISVFEWFWRVNIVKLKDWRTVRNLFSSKRWVDFVSFKFIASKITFLGCNFTKNRPEANKMTQN